MILHLVSGLFYGGGQQVAVDLVRALREGDEAAELCILGDRSEIMAEAAQHRVAFDGRYNRIRSLVATGMRLRRVLKRVRPRVVHTHGWDASMVGAIATLGMGIAQVTHWHTTDEWLVSRSIKHKGRRWLTNRMVAGRRKRIVAVSAASRDHLCQAMGWDKGRVQVLHNGVDMTRFTPPRLPRKGESNESLIIGTVSRLASGKGLQFLVAALAMFDESQRQRVQLRIAGEGSYRAELEQQVAELGLDSIVSFVGHVDAAAFYRTLDVFVLPSLTEGLPLCVLEAMASGCPTITTAVGGIPEIITDGVHGLLVPPRDIAALKYAVERLVDRAALRDQLSQRGRERIVEHFALSRVTADITKLYRGFDQHAESGPAAMKIVEKSVA